MMQERVHEGDGDDDDEEEAIALFISMMKIEKVV
jgi:hypothetical protein